MKIPIATRRRYTHSLLSNLDPIANARNRIESQHTQQHILNLLSHLRCSAS